MHVNPHIAKPITLYSLGWRVIASVFILSLGATASLSAQIIIDDEALKQAQAAEGLGISNSELGQVTQLLQLANGDLADLEGLLNGELGGSKQIKDKLLDKLKGKLFSD